MPSQNATQADDPRPAATDAVAAGPGAVVIPFPSHKAEAAAKARLDRALESLLRATEEQSRAVALWRSALGELHHTMGDLTTSMTRYQTALAETGAKVDALGREARQLEATMDAVLDGSLTPGGSATAG